MNINKLSSGMAELIEVAGTITKLSSSVRGRVVISGSHGGELPAGLAIRAGARAVLLNDAGGGLEDAGIGSLALCQRFGMAAATVSHNSCRIGDGDDMIARGLISHANNLAISVGVRVGQTCLEAAERMTNAPQPPQNEPPEFSEYRGLLEIDGAVRALILVDSASMVVAEDAGQVVLTGSHGGLIGNNPKAAIKAPVFAAFYNDAGIGIEDWGTTRLPALDDQGIAGITLDCMTCRIGDARSAYDAGIVSAVNKRAQELGVRVDMKARNAAEILCR